MGLSFWTDAAVSFTDAAFSFGEDGGGGASLAAGVQSLALAGPDDVRVDASALASAWVQGLELEAPAASAVLGGGLDAVLDAGVAVLRLEAPEASPSAHARTKAVSVALFLSGPAVVCAILSQRERLFLSSRIHGQFRTRSLCATRLVLRSAMNARTG